MEHEIDIVPNGNTALTGNPKPEKTLDQVVKEHTEALTEYTSANATEERATLKKMKAYKRLSLASDALFDFKRRAMVYRPTIQV
jgi:hypothetical protein